MTLVRITEVSIEYGSQVAERLLEDVPEFREQYEEHLRDNDELLLHLLVADLARFSVAAELAGDAVLVDRVLAAVERLFVDGDELTKELLAVSFVEHLGAETEPGESEVVRRLPSELAAELRRERDWRPH